MDYKKVRDAGYAMAASFRHLSWFFVVGGSVFGYNTDVQHFKQGLALFVGAQAVSLLLTILWASLDVKDDEEEK